MESFLLAYTSSHALSYGVFCAPHTILSIRAYGDESSSNPASGDWENMFSVSLPSALLMSCAVKTCMVGDACELVSLVFRVCVDPILSSRSSAETDRVIGVDCSAGSTSLVTSISTWITFCKSPRARSLRLCSPRIPSKRAELKERCTADQDRVANGVMLCKPRNASTVLVRLSIHVLRSVLERSKLAVAGLMAGRHSSDVTYEMWRYSAQCSSWSRIDRHLRESLR